MTLLKFKIEDKNGVEQLNGEFPEETIKLEKMGDICEYIKNTESEIIIPMYEYMSVNKWYNVDILVRDIQTGKQTEYKAKKVDKRPIMFAGKIKSHITSHISNLNERNVLIYSKKSTKYMMIFVTENKLFGVN